MPTIKFRIDEKSCSKRFDLVCVDYTDLSRRKIRAIIDVGGAYLNGKRVRVASRMVRDSDCVTLIYNDQELKTITGAKCSFTKKDILFENNDIVVVNKPAGLCSQATRTQTKNHLLAVVQNFMNTNSLRLVHRLDKDTSGAVVLAKNDRSCSHIEELFKSHKVEKIYHAICFGKLRSVLEDHSPLSSIGKDGMVRILDKDHGGKEAFTKFIPKAYNPKYNVSLVECIPYTGRSHQIRVHLEHQGLVLVGEKKYGGGMFLKEKQKIQELQVLVNRGMLHAYSIKFRCFGTSVHAVANYHDDFLKLKKELSL